MKNIGTLVGAPIMPIDSKDEINSGDSNCMLGGPFQFEKIYDATDPEQPFNSMYTIPLVRRRWGCQCTITGEVDETKNVVYELKKGHVDNNLMNNQNWTPYTPEAPVLDDIQFRLIKRIETQGNGLLIDQDRKQYFVFIGTNSTIDVRSLVDDSLKVTINVPSSVYNHGAIQGVIFRGAMLSQDRLYCIGYDKLYVINPNDSTFAITNILTKPGNQYASLDLVKTGATTARLLLSERPFVGQGYIDEYTISTLTNELTFVRLLSGLSYPNDIKVDLRYNRLWICERFAAKVSVWNLTTFAKITDIVTDFSAPAYLCLDYSSNTVLASDVNNGNLSMINMQSLEVVGKVGNFIAVEGVGIINYEDFRVRYYFLRREGINQEERYLDILIEK